jgi:hypothetical protein
VRLCRRLGSGEVRLGWVARRAGRDGSTPRGRGGPEFIGSL